MGSWPFGGRPVAIVLVVEDEAQVLVFAESYLADQGHQTLSASTVAEAQAIIDSDADIDLLFTDIGLGTDDPQGGLELATEAVAARPGLKVLYTTGQTVTDGMRALFVEGAAVLEKPYAVDELSAALSQLGINSSPTKTAT
jgi:DNA-binding NtrC family response regulator